MDMFEIMDRESSSRSEVYLYEENGNGMHTTIRQACSKVGCRDYQTEEPCMLLLWCYAGEGGGRP